MAASNFSVPRVHSGQQFVPALLAASGVVGCVVLEKDGAICWMNSLLLRWIGLADLCVVRDLKPKHWIEREEDREALHGALDAGGGQNLSLTIRSIGAESRSVVGELTRLDDDAGGHVFIGIFRDISAERKLSTGMQQNARLEALGSLTSGVAHDFNNLLTILVGNLSLLAEDLRSQPKIFAKVKVARDAARRGSELIRRLLAFARQKPVASKPINPSVVIAGIAPLIQRALGRKITLDFSLDETLDPVLGNSAQLESVIVNLAVNARDAIAESGAVTIAVSSAFPGNDIAAAQEIAGRHYLRIEVRDTGEGMEPEVLDKAFDPFFTTKEMGQGSGLGLSMVRSYAEQFDGFAEIESRVGLGTCVRLWFPMSDETLEDTAAMTMPAEVLPNGTERVLVFSPDEILSATVMQILGVLGYECSSVADADEVGPLLESFRPELIVSDGIDLAGFLGERFAAYDRVLMLNSLDATSTGNCRFRLIKPFSLPDLAITVREALDAEI